MPRVAQKFTPGMHSDGLGCITLLNIAITGLEDMDLYGIENMWVTRRTVDQNDSNLIRVAVRVSDGAVQGIGHLEIPAECAKSFADSEEKARSIAKFWYCQELVYDHSEKAGWFSKVHVYRAGNARMFVPYEAGGYWTLSIGKTIARPTNKKELAELAA
jgi:hypothetical protein